MEERPHELPAFAALSQRLDKTWQTLAEVEDEMKDVEEGFLILLDCGATISPLDQVMKFSTGIIYGFWTLLDHP